MKRGRAAASDQITCGSKWVSKADRHGELAVFTVEGASSRAVRLIRDDGGVHNVTLACLLEDFVPAPEAAAESPAGSDVDNSVGAVELTVDEAEFMKPENGVVPEAPAEMLGMQDIALAAIEESKTNQRRHFDKVKLGELRDSIRTHGVLAPILVRPMGSVYELVAGARRLRAARELQLVSIPCIVRALNDRQAIEAQVIENLQRQDVHPLEEADGYHLLMTLHGMHAEQLAAKVGKSKGYIYGRLKLRALPKKARKLFEEGALDASTALLVARIPDPELAEKAADDLCEGWNGDPMSYREAKRHVQQEYMLRLAVATFDVKDATLVPAAGICSACPKRTGNQLELFGDVDNKDTCTDPTCFGAKTAAAVERKKTEAADKGQKILEGKAASRAMHSGDYVRVDETCYGDKRPKTYGQLIKKAGGDVETVLAQDPNDPHRLVELVPKKQAKAALKKLGINDSSTSPTSSSSSRDNAARKRHKQRMSAVTLAMPELFEKIATAIEGEVLLFLIEAISSRCGDGTQAVARYLTGDEKLKWSPYTRRMPKELKAKLQLLDLPQLRATAVLLVACNLPSYTHATGYSPDWNAACKLAGVDMQVHTRAAAAAKPAKKSQEDLDEIVAEDLKRLGKAKKTKSKAKKKKVGAGK